MCIQPQPAVKQQNVLVVKLTQWNFMTGEGSWKEGGLGESDERWGRKRVGWEVVGCQRNITSVDGKRTTSRS